MKICICGKGGSGKSTLVGLLARELHERGKQVVVVDADESNSSLYRLLGLDHRPLPLMDLLGGNKEVRKDLRARFARGEAALRQPI